MPEAGVKGIRLYYEEHGEGAPILCIHGGGSSALLWVDAVKELARLGRVIAYDRRGCTRSERPHPYERTSVTEQADDAAALLDVLAATPAVVIGRSYGGAVAIDLALRYRDRVRALVLLEGDALGLSTAALEWTKGIRDRLREVAAHDGVDAVYEALISEVLGEGAWDSFPEEVRRILSHNGPALLAELHYVDEPMPRRRRVRHDRQARAAGGGIRVPARAARNDRSDGSGAPQRSHRARRRWPSHRPGRARRARLRRGSAR